MVENVYVKNLVVSKFLKDFKFISVNIILPRWQPCLQQNRTQTNMYVRTHPMPLCFRNGLSILKLFKWVSLVLLQKK